MIIGSLITLISCDTVDFPAKDVTKCIVTGALVASLAVWVPSKQDLALIFAYPYLKSGAQQAVKSETAQKLTTAANKYLDKVIADLDKPEGQH